MTFFQNAYLESDAPWDTGRPQAEVIALAEAGEIVGSVLDIGCGTGENALFIAERGHVVLGIDRAPRAIELAREKATARGVEAEFTVCDVLQPPAFGRAFDTAIDSGVFHVFDDDGKEAYVRCALEALRPGGTLHLIVWSELEHAESGPARVTQAELKRFFSQGWEDIRIRAGIYETSFHETGAKAWVASMRRSE